MFFGGLLDFGFVVGVVPSDSLSSGLQLDMVAIPMNKFHFVFLAALAMLTFACESSTTTSTDANPAAASGDSVAPAPENPQKTTAITVKLGCREIRNTDDISPLAEVVLTVGDKTFAVDSCNVCADLEPASWEQYKIPKDAKAAVGGWWAGGGEYFYLSLQGTDAVVYAGWADEGAAEKDMYQYKEIQRSPLVAKF